MSPCFWSKNSVRMRHLLGGDNKAYLETNQLAGLGLSRGGLHARFSGKARHRLLRSPPTQPDCYCQLIGRPKIGKTDSTWTGYFKRSNHKRSNDQHNARLFSKL